MAVTIQARSGEMQNNDSYIGGYVCSYITIYGTLEGRKLTITKVDLRAYHWSNQYNTTNWYKAKYTINGWTIGDYTIKGTTGSNSHVDYNGTLWTGTKEMTLPIGASSINVEGNVWDQGGRTLSSNGQRPINLGTTVQIPIINFKANGAWATGSSIYYKNSGSWKKVIGFYNKQNSNWQSLFNDLWIIKNGQIITPITYKYNAGTNQVVSWSYNSTDRCQDFRQPIWSDCNVYPTTAIDMTKYRYAYIDAYCSTNNSYHVLAYRGGSNNTNTDNIQELLSHDSTINPRKTFKVPLNQTAWNFMLGFTNLDNAVVKIYNIRLSRL